MNSYTELTRKISGKRIAVLGLGVSNLPLVRLLLRLGVCRSITVYDKKVRSELESADSLAALGVNFVQGFEEICADIIFRSPGIRPDHPSILSATERGAILSSEMEEFLALCSAMTFGITGSDGKTTTTTLCGKFLEASGRRTFVGGNIGTPLLEYCADMTEQDSAVLELSSFQLMTPMPAPMNSAITNLSPNHLDWHTDESEYALAKRNIVGEQTRRVVLNYDCPHTLSFGKTLCTGKREIIFFSSKIRSVEDFSLPLSQSTKLIFIDNGIISISDGAHTEPLLDTKSIRLPGVHNIENYMCAIGLTYKYVPSEIYKSIAESFLGVEHRLELVRTHEGVDYFNSSIDSSPSRTAAALSALGGRDIVIICGGYDKNLSYDSLADIFCKSVRTVVLTGANAEKIESAILNCPKYKKECPKIINAKSFEDALLRAKGEARQGGCVLLSPASASFDRFKNFAERGKYFAELVNRL